MIARDRHLTRVADAVIEARHCIGQQFFGYPQAAAFNLLAWWGMAVDDNDMFIFSALITAPATFGHSE